MPDRPGTATALALSGDPELLRLPADWAGRVNLGLDVLRRANLPGWTEPEPLPVAGHDTGHTPIQLLEHWVERVALGGRAMAAVASAESDRARLHRLGLTGAAGVLGALATAARDQHGDPFGRLVTGDEAAFPRAWLRAGLYLRAFHRSVAEHSWAAEESLPEN